MVQRFTHSICGEPAIRIRQAANHKTALGLTTEAVGVQAVSAWFGTSASTITSPTARAIWCMNSTRLTSIAFLCRLLEGQIKRCYA